jgi:predicted Kef-type K+ transport protein
MNPHVLSFIRDHVSTLPVLAKFALGMVMIVAIPRLCRRLHVPAAVGLLLGGVIIGPYVLGFFGADRPIADFMAELGKLLLMFFAGLEIDLALFRRARNRSIAFGFTTTVLPLAFGTAVGLVFGYTVIPAIVIGSLLASHTLLGLTVLDKVWPQRSGTGDGDGRCHGDVRHIITRCVRHLPLDLYDWLLLVRADAAAG